MSSCESTSLRAGFWACDSSICAPNQVKASPGTKAAAAVQAINLQAGDPMANVAEKAQSTVPTLIGALSELSCTAVPQPVE